MLLGACELAGFRLRPRRPRGDPRVGAVLRHSGWGVVLHTGAGLLLGAAIVAGAAVEGGVVAYQVGWVIFLAPYAVLAQPIHTAILPELVTEAREHGPARVAASLRWALERMALLVVPASRGDDGAGPAGHAARVLRRGRDRRAASCWPPRVAGLALGLLPYSAFLLLARGYYALGDSRTPGLVSVACAPVGVAVMVAGSLTARRRRRASSCSASATRWPTPSGVVVLGVGLARRTGGSLWPAALGRVVGVSAVVGVGAWRGERGAARRRHRPAGRPGRRSPALGLVGGRAVLARLPGPRRPRGARRTSATPGRPTGRREAGA